MPVERTLLRAEEDLRAGRTALARQRIRGLVASMPERLDLRERLAQVYRAEGDLAQAGRWSYLSEYRYPAEEAAFGRLCGGDPVRMMRALSWRAAEDDAATETARGRLRALRAEAEMRAGGPVDWADPRYPESPRGWLDRLATPILILVGGAWLVVVIPGAVEAVGAVIGWLADRIG
ncbi:DUF6584 family protein [Georgenia faecalis]|uniref:DUF6584 family protein n=1 Tax=Georgenia faecalis TaxID=2483799 RepID=UPI000FDB1D23|nr:DUF6584 family protein [Georgenia faecalis]